MFIFIAVLTGLIAYLIPGAMLARGWYSREVREIRTAPRPITPPQPARPEINLSDMLHATVPRRCGALSGRGNACDCRFRKEWVKLKNDWLDYDDWVYKYDGKNVDDEYVVNTRAIYAAMLVWPVVALAAYVTGGADNIPDYRAIEQFEQLNEIGE